MIINNNEIVLYKNKTEEDLIENLFEYLEKNEIRETLYAHNLTFDGLIIIENITKKKKIKFNAILFKSSIYEMEIWSKKFKLKLKCSLKLFPLPLKKIGKLIGEDSEKIDFPHEFVKEDNYLTYQGIHPRDNKIIKWNLREECIKYCIKDCKIVNKMLNIIFKEEKVKEELKSRSISGLSLEVFKKIFNKKGLETCMNKENDKIIREAYFGGRCEVFGNAKEEERIFHFDFTGMYSEIMKEEFCFGKIKIEKEIETKEIEEPGFYEVTVISKEMKIPVLPYRNEDGKLIFPNGKWKGTYWYEEIKLFIEEGGTVEKVHKKITFEKKDKPFIDFINYFSKLRNKSNLDNVFWKLFVNSIYGRMGMSENKEKTEIVDIRKYRKIEKNKRIIKEIIINNAMIITYVENREKKEIDSNVAIAAAITSKARIKLFKAYKEVIKKEGRLLYSDTDSIFAAYKRDVSGEKHGEILWDIDKKDTIIEKAIFAIPKGYALKFKEDSTIKIKGFKKDSISYEEFEKTFKEKKELVTTESYLEKVTFQLKFKEIEKTIILHNYDKRKFNKDKSDTEPLYIEKIIDP